MAIFDIMKPQVSKVVKGLEGKTMLVYGGNSIGKTLQGTRMKKPLVLPFEHGLNAISGVPFFPINSWSDFKKINMSLTNPRTLDKVKEQYQTIIFDEVQASANYCQEYLCAKHDAESIGDGNGGYGLWKEYETEFWREINRLTKAGFTVYFIAHEQVDRDTGQVVPKGDKRAIAPIQDLADITIHLKSNGVDEDGRVIKSSGYLAETPEYFARSRFDYIDTVIPEYTAENLEEVLIRAIEEQAKRDGTELVSHDEFQEMNSTDLDYDEVMEQIKEQYMRLKEEDKLESYQDVVDEYLGKDAIVSEATEKQLDLLGLILHSLIES